MNPAIEKECDISKFKVKKVKTNYLTYMAFPDAGGGGSPIPGGGAAGAAAEAIPEVAEAISQMKGEEEQRDQAEEKRDEQQQEEINKQEEKQKEESTEEEAIKKTMIGGIKRKIKKIRSGVPSTWKIVVCLIVALIYDIVDIIISIATLFASESGEWVGDIPMQAFFSLMLGKHYKRMALVEFIPVVDVLPWYTVSVIRSWLSVRRATGEIKGLKKDEKGLEGTGGPRAPGFLEISKQGWTFLLVLTGFATISFYMMGGLALAILPIIIFLIIIFLLALRDEETRGIALGLFFSLLILGLLAGGFFFILAPNLAGTGIGGPLGDKISDAAVAGQDFKNTLAKMNPVTSIKNYYKKQLAIATGDYYTGKVDENAQAKLGVYLEDLKQADPTFYENRPVTLFATLTVQTLDKVMNVDLYCKSDKQKEGTTPSIFPQESFLVDSYEEKEIDCKFESGDLDKGAQTIKFGARFNFKTMSYVKSYFMDLERLRSMRREEIDPLDQYGITDKAPIATYTVGPVGIGMGVGKPPVGIDLGAQQTTMTLGITIENKWDGIITKINRMVIIVPKGFDLIDLDAPYEPVLCADLPDEEKDLCSDEENNVYVVTTDTIPRIPKNNYKSYRAHMKINKANYDKVLGLNPITTKYFKTTVDYTYDLEKEKTIDVKSSQIRTGSPLFGGGDASYDVTSPKISEFKATKQEDGTVLVSWKTDESSNDIFEYFETLRPYAVTPTPNEVTFDTLHSRNLGTVGTTGYSYRIITEDQNGNRDERTGELTITGG